MKKKVVMHLTVAGLVACTAAGSDDGLIQYPALSPDGQTIVFSAAGDLWAIGSDGGHASRLTVHPGIETRAVFSPDGQTIAFESNRDGAQNIYAIDVSGEGASAIARNLRRVTVSDRAHTLSGFRADGSAVLFSASIYPEIYRHVSMFSAPLDGGPMSSISDAFGRMPTESADGEWIYFNRGYFYPHRMVYRGPGNIDLWRMHKDGETFEQLTSFNGNDMDGCPLPDGSMLYISSRDGQYNVWKLKAGESDISSSKSTRKMTAFTPGEGEHTIAHGVRDLQVSRDGSSAVFVVWNTMYTIDLTRNNAKPVAISIEMGTDLGRDLIDDVNVSSMVSEAAVHPSGDAVVVSARGDLFLRSTKEGRPTRRITDTPYREQGLAWSPDGSVLYFSSDTEDGLSSIFSVGVALSGEDIIPDEPAEISEEDTDMGEDPSASGEEGAQAGEDDSESGDDDAVEEDDKSSEEESKPEEPEVDYAKRWSEALRFEFNAVVTGETAIYAPTPSPDGTKLIYKKERGDVILRDLESGEERMLFASWSDPAVHWASDSRHVYYENSDLDFNTDIFLLDTDLDEDGDAFTPINISQHPDIDHSPRLSHDGKVLIFLSDRDNENWEFDVYAVYLDSSLEGSAAYAMDEYFEEAAKAAKGLKPIKVVQKNGDDEDQVDEGVLEFDAEDAFLRVRRLTSTPESESDLVMTPGGDRVVFSTVIDGKRSYVSVDPRGRDRKSVYSGGVGDVRMGLNGSSMSFVASGQARTVSPTGGKVTTHGISAINKVDRRAERAQKFNETSRRFGMTFYHPTMKGLDWAGISVRYDELTSFTRTNQAFQRLMNLMFGEADGSHTGIWGGDGFSAGSPSNGYLGIEFSASDLGYRVDAILKGGAIEEMTNGPEVGDLIVSINDQSLVGAETASGLLDLHAQLAGLARKEVLLEYVRTGPEGESQTLYGMVTPSSYSSSSVMRYENEVLRRRAVVEERSGGRLGYLHIRSMGLASVRDFERDLYAAAHGKEGLVIDVRDNGGGWTTDILLASLTAPAHAYTIPRGADPDDVRFDSYPRDRRLIYAWNRPINVLINQHSFSNAEIFAHSIKTIGRGKIIGTQTFGGVISTGSFRLIDGTTVRRPFRGWYLPDGTDMESNGTIPDINVSQTPTDEVRGIDRQLQTAVDTMLADLDAP